jgi:two-component system phosphate regulon response regulator PhoB
MTRAKIILVEDDPWLAELEERVLAKEGYAVRVAPDGDAAIDLLDDELPDLIIVDMLLTGTTAFALLHELQSYGDTGLLPVIICTNMAESLELEELAPYGVKRIVNKSTMQPADLVAAVRSVLA